MERSPKELLRKNNKGSYAGSAGGNLIATFFIILLATMVIKPISNLKDMVLRERLIMSCHLKYNTLDIETLNNFCKKLP